MDSALLGVIGITVIIVGALMLAMWQWDKHVTTPRNAERLRARLAEPRVYAAHQGWQVLEYPAGYTGDRPLPGLLAQQVRGRQYQVLLAVNGSRAGHDIYGLWMRSSNTEGMDLFSTVFGLLLPRAYRVELSVWPRPRWRARRAGLTGDTDTDFESGFRVRWDPGETGWTAHELLTPELRAALLSGEAYPRWKLSDRYLGATSPWMSGGELDAAVNALIVVAGHLHPSPAGSR